jgi:hypothetical protein
MMNSATGPTLSPLLAASHSRPEVGSAQVQSGIKSLDIGCGKSKTSGCIGIDRVTLPGVDVVHDLDQFPWPFPDDEFSIIYAIISWNMPAIYLQHSRKFTASACPTVA